MINGKVSSINAFIDDLLPEHISANYPEFVYFAKAYAEYLQNENRSGYFLNRINEQRDIDTVEEEFLTQLQKEIGASIPRSFAADPRLFYKQLVSFYQSRGTVDSIETFFKLLYDDEVEIYFPKEDMLIPSDGRWVDQSDEVINNKDAFSPTHTFTIASNTTELTGRDDNDIWLSYDNPIVYKNGTYVNPAEYTSSTYIRSYDSGEDQDETDSTTEILAYKLTFETQLQVDDVIQIYRTGAFTTNDGFVSDDKKLQDSFFYQKFSYVLRTGSNIDLWKNAFNRLVHPSGFIFFGEILLQVLLIDKQIGNTVEVQPGFQFGGLPITIVVPEVTATASVIKTQDQLLASFVAKEFVWQAMANKFGPAQSLEYIKFFTQSPNVVFGDYTIEDAINKNIPINMTSTVEIETI